MQTSLAATTEPLLFPDLIRENARRNGDRAAVLWDGGSLTWADLDTLSDEVAATLVAEGGGIGDRATLAGLGSAEYVITLAGVLKAGMSIVPLSTMATPEIMERLLADCGARYIFADSYCAAALAGRIPAHSCAISFGQPPTGWIPFDTWRAKSASPTPSLQLTGDTEFNVIYSSGTTGTPKGIVHDHSLRAAQIQAFKAFGLSSNTLTILATALYTNYSLAALLATLGAGGCVYLMPGFRVGDFLAACRALPVTHAFLVPVQINRILAHPGFDDAAGNRSMTVFSAGSPLPPARKREMLERWPGFFVEIYGATEGGASTILVATQYPDKLTSVGRPTEGCDIRIVGEDGAEVPVGEAGEIVGCSPMMMRGYLNRKDDTDSLLWHSSSGGVYIRSGDIGYFDEDGFLYLSDRKRDIIISGGLNVFAADLEEVLQQHEGVSECAVVAAPSERWGETPVAFVIPANAVSVPEQDLLNWANSRLSRHQQLSRVIYRSTLPRNEMGKIVKKDLRQELAPSQR